MPYNPGVENKAGQIYGNAVVGAAQARSQGIVEAARTRALIAQQNQQNLFQGISSAASAIGGAFQQYNKDKFQTDFLTGRMENFASKGLVSPDDMTKFMGASAGKKAAMFADASATWENFLKTQQGQQELANRVSLARQTYDIENQNLGKPTFEWNGKEWTKAGVQTGTHTYSPTAQPNVSNQPQPMRAKDSSGNLIFIQPVLGPNGNWSWPPTAPDGKPYTPIEQKGFFAE